MGNGLRRWRRVVVALAFGGALTLSQVLPASASDTPLAIAAFTYVSPIVVSPAGNTVSVTNLDGLVSAHNVVSLATNPSTGQPWFRSPLSAALSAVDVAGVSSTPPGVYQFTCDLHAFMTGVLVVV